MNHTHDLHRTKLLRLIKKIPNDQVFMYYSIVNDLNKRIGANEKRNMSERGKLVNHINKFLQSQSQEKMVLKKKLKTAVTFIKKSLMEKKRLEKKVKYAKTSCGSYEKKVNALSERLVEFIRFNKRSSELMKRLRTRYENEVEKNRRLQEEMKKIKILAELEDDDTTSSIPFPKVEEEELVAPAPPRPSINRLLLASRINNEIEETTEDETTTLPPPPPPLISVQPPPLPPGAPPPPPLLMSSPEGGFAPDWQLTPKKKKTVSVRIGKIARRRLSRSVFKKEKLLLQGQERFWNDSIAFLLEEKFKVRPRSRSVSPTRDGFRHGRPRSKSCVKSLVDSQKSLNSAIVCAKIEDKEFVTRSIRNSDEWCYKDGAEIMTKIFQVVSMFSPEEKEAVVSKSKDLSEEYILENYSPGDQFILKLFNIPLLEKKLGLFEFIESHKNDEPSNQLEVELELYLSLCDELKESKKFRSFLSLVLVIINFLNQEEVIDNEEEEEHEEETKEENESNSTTPLPKKRGNHSKKKPVIGISVRSLLNLVRVKNSENPKENLMDVIYEILEESHPEILEFQESFSSVREIVKQSLIEEKKEMFKKFKASVTKVKHTSLTELRKASEVQMIPSNDPLISQLENLIPSLEEKMVVIQDLFDRVDEKISLVSDHYGHPKESIGEFFSDLNEVILLLEKTKKKRVDLKRSEERRERRRIMMEKRRSERSLRVERRIIYDEDEDATTTTTKEEEEEGEYDEMEEEYEITNLYGNDSPTESYFSDLVNFQREREDYDEEIKIEEEIGEEDEDSENFDEGDSTPGIQSPKNLSPTKGMKKSHSLGGIVGMMSVPRRVKVSKKRIRRISDLLSVFRE